MIEVYCEIVCDHCGNAIYHSLGANKTHAEKDLRDVGCIVTGKKKHFCDKECHQNYKIKKRIINQIRIRMNQK